MAHSSTSPNPELVARLRAAGCVFAEDEARMLESEAHSPADLDAMVERRVAGLPLEHVLGWVEFGGLRIQVDPGVFVPRPRTEFLVEQALADAPPDGAVVVDLCCGCGALGVAIAAGLVNVELHAADIDPAAAACARRNVEPIGGDVSEGDLFDALPDSLRGRIDVLAANVPYVPTDAISTMPQEARVHEPRVALDGGTDGLDVLRRVAASAPDWLARGGRMFVETSTTQAAAALDAVELAGLDAQLARSEELDVTVVIGSRQ